MRASDVLSRIDLVRINNQVLNDAGRLEPVTLRSLDAIHLATAALFETTLSGLITYDSTMTSAARSFGWKVASPAS
jgi:predicted nucleic acid-binding protein